MDPQWLRWARELQAIAQNGLTFAQDPFDRERYEAVRAIASAMIAQPAGVTPADITSLFSPDPGYMTPKVDVRAAVFKDDTILLVKEASDGGWTLPGGWADVGDAPGEAAAREVLEEAGYRVRPVKLLAVYDRSRHDHPPHVHDIYKLFFRCELEDENPVDAKHQGLETDGVGFFRLDELPALSVGRVTATQIARLFAHAANPAWPTDFD